MLTFWWKKKIHLNWKIRVKVFSTISFKITINDFTNSDVGIMNKILFTNTNCFRINYVWLYRNTCSLNADFDYGLLSLPEQNIGITTGVTCQQGMLRTWSADPTWCLPCSNFHILYRIIETYNFSLFPLFITLHRICIYMYFAYLNTSDTVVQ